MPIQFDWLMEIKREPKRTECWQTLNQNIWSHHFQTIISFHLIPPIVFFGLKRLVPSAEKNSGQKSGALCQAIWDLTQRPAIFSQSRFKFNTCVDINLRDQSAVKDHAPEWSLRWCREKNWTKPYHSPIKKYKSQCIGKQNGVCDSIFFSKNDACLQLKKI